MTKLLIVDDTEQNRYMLQAILEGHGYQVATARDGAEALAEARRDPPDMVITDILMPVMDGFTLCRQWKADERLKTIPFVFYTAAYADPKDEELGLSLGADRFVVKPVVPDVLVGIVQEVMAAHEVNPLTATREPQVEEEVFLREYNEALVRKLEHKLLELEVTNQALEQRVAERERMEEWLERLNRLREDLLSPGSLDEKLKRTTDGVVAIFDADFACIWIIEPGDLCDSGCPHAGVKEGPHACLNRDRCLHLMASSGRYTRVDDEMHRRVPFDCYRIGRVAAGEDVKFITNDVATDPHIHDREWAKELGLASFAGYRLLSANGQPIGVLALFSRHAISSEEDALLEGVANTIAQVIQNALAERALRESEEKYRLLIENASEAIGAVDSEGRFLVMNSAAARVLGGQPSDFIGRTVWDVLPKDFAQERMASARKVIQSGQGHVIEISIPVQGQTRWFRQSTQPIRDGAGKITSALSLSTDVTEQKQAEETMQRRNRELALFNRTSQVFGSTLDLDRVLASVLEEVCHLLDVTAGSVWLTDQETNELVCRQATGSQSENVHGWRLAPGVGIAGWTVRLGESQIISDAQADERHFRAVDEKTGIVVRSILSVPLRVKGDVIGALQVVDTDADRFSPTDVALVEPLAASASIAIENARLHQRLQAHANQLEQWVQERTFELQAQYAHLDAILNSTTDGIVVADRVGNIVRANPVAQKWLTQTLLPEDTERLREAVRDLAQRANGQPEMVLELAGRDLELVAAPVVGGGAGEPSAVVVDIHDISALKALDRMKTMLIVNVAHELRTPIATIQSYAYLVQQTPPEDEKWGKYLDALVREADAQTQLGEEILQISRIYAGQLEVRPRPTSLSELTEIAFTHHQALAQERGVTLEHQPTRPSQVENEGLSVSADPRQMLQVLNYLVGDAIHYTSAEGQVTITIGRQEMEGRAWATAAVSNTGKGVPTEDLPYIFERFFREGEPLSARVSETGLRLMIVKGIVDLHNGRVTVESETGIGTTFTVWLPLIA
jgi:PAS domain S-box-containing protein